MKFLIRRIRYAFAGHVMRGIMAIFSLIAVGVFVIVMMSGAVNQRNLFEKIFGFTWNSSKNIATHVENKGVPGDITDQGVYFPGSAPEGASKYDVGKKEGNTSVNTDDSENANSNEKAEDKADSNANNDSENKSE